MRLAHPDAAFCVAGDFSMSLGGAHGYDPVKGRSILSAGIAEAGLTVVTEWDRLPTGALPHSPIDYIALSSDLAGRAEPAAATPAVFYMPTVDKDPFLQRIPYFAAVGLPLRLIDGSRIRSKPPFEHPTLADHVQRATTPTPRRARAVVIAADRLRTTLAGYRAAVDAATRVSDPADAAGF